MTLDAIEFEITDFAAAREALDALPDGLAKVKTLVPGYWEAMRRKQLPRERALAGPTIRWLVGLPSALRPHALCERYPRVANELAEAWPCPAERTAMLDTLLVDRRGGRRGFGLEVQHELGALRHDQ
jgi:hypothetical protein